MGARGEEVKLMMRGRWRGDYRWQGALPWRRGGMMAIVIEESGGGKVNIATTFC